MKIHIVQKGDTLWKIAQKYGVDFEALKKINGHLSDPNYIMPGMKIKIPTAGVPVKKEMQKKETVVHMHPKKEEPIEHPYAEAKPFVSFNIEAEIAPNVNVNPKVKETPKEANMNANPSMNEAPETPNIQQPLPEPPKAPIAQKPQAPSAEKKELPKAPVKEPEKAPLENVMKEAANDKKPAEAPYTIPPVSPNPYAHWNMPPLPTKPANILPNMMKPDVEDIESPEKAVHHDAPPELPAVPYVPMWPQPQQPWGYAPQPNQPNELTNPQAQPQEHCVPVTPVMPGYGFYYPSMPFVGYPAAPMPMQVESSSHMFPGIHESSESHGWMPPAPPAGMQYPTAPMVGMQYQYPVAPPAGIPYPMVPPAGMQYPTSPPAGMQYPTSPAGMQYPPIGMQSPEVSPTDEQYQAPAPTAGQYMTSPLPGYAPLPPSYGGSLQYAPYYSQPQGPSFSAPFAPLPPQPSAFPPSPQQLFMMPQYGESSEHDE
ncbi:SafA/ExsA family spore coat assembly protein [Anoxybacteroides amylolyticum]|uniref:Spore coat assembly SafA n=1 Tax=Anoxybacteroides amylolyticum TaxID=294699 RepID=A0A160F289_9BACL|nr:SafA/ExsA family spore coat assembly protein [Anoxybacillus amylolyticus]ANB60328.1 spore coat assembly SafA [Anoxybacillus amylolyticus]